MDDPSQQYDSLIRSAVQRLKGHQRRLFQAEVTNALCAGSPRAAERRFGWGRDCVQKGLHEADSGLRCVENFAAKGALTCEQKDPQLATDIRAIVEPHTQADPELKSSRRYTNLSAKEVLQALKSQKGYSADRLPKERTMRDILNRMGYRPVLSGRVYMSCRQVQQPRASANFGTSTQVGKSLGFGLRQKRSPEKPSPSSRSNGDYRFRSVSNLFKSVSTALSSSSSRTFLKWITPSASII